MPPARSTVASENSRVASEARRALEALLADADELLDVLRQWNTPAPRGAFELLEGLAIPPSPLVMPRENEGTWLAIFTLRDSADPEGCVMPYRAKMMRDADAGGEWRLTRIDSQCASCFGSGVVEADLRPCDTCGGAGWGQIATEAYRI